MTPRPTRATHRPKPDTLFEVIYNRDASSALVHVTNTSESTFGPISGLPLDLVMFVPCHFQPVLVDTIDTMADALVSGAYLPYLVEISTSSSLLSAVSGVRGIIFRVGGHTDILST